MLARVRPHHGTWSALNVWRVTIQNTKPRKQWTHNLNAAIFYQLHLCLPCWALSCVWLDGRRVIVDAVHFFPAHALMFGLCLGSHCGEAHPRKSSQSFHCDAGLRLPDQDWPLPGHDHHEWWRSQVLNTNTDLDRSTILLTHCCILVSVLNIMGTVYSNLY